MPGLIARIRRHILNSRRRSHSVNVNDIKDPDVVNHQANLQILKTENENIISVDEQKHKSQNIFELGNNFSGNSSIQIESLGDSTITKLETETQNVKQLGGNLKKNLELETSKTANKDNVEINEQKTSTEVRSPSKPAITCKPVPPQCKNTVRSRRVLKELQNLMELSESTESSFEVELVDDSNIYEWEVRLVRPNPSSELWRSMKENDIKCITFNMTFPENFPFQPPFMRLVSPHIDNGFVMDGGAICLEVLTTQGWSSAYTIESLLVQVMAGMIRGGATVSKKQRRKRNKLTKKRAEHEFRRISKIHAKYGWVSSDKEDNA